jgi:hypothetical protein
MDKLSNKNTIKYRRNAFASVLTIMAAAVLACQLSAGPQYPVVSNSNEPEMSVPTITEAPIEITPIIEVAIPTFTAIPTETNISEPTATDVVPTVEPLIQAVVPQQVFCPMYTADLQEKLTDCSAGPGSPNHQGGGYDAAADFPLADKVSGDERQGVLVAPKDGFIFFGPHIKCDGGTIPTILFISADGTVNMRAGHVSANGPDRFALAGEVIGNVENGSGPCSTGGHLHIVIDENITGQFLTRESYFANTEVDNDPLRTLNELCDVKIACKVP